MEIAHHKWNEADQDVVLAEYHKQRMAGLPQIKAIKKAVGALPPDRRVSPHSMLLWKLNKLYQADTRFDKNTSPLPPSRNGNGNGHHDEYNTAQRDTGNRIKWTPAELAAVAGAWIELRLADPFKDSAPLLLEKAQRKVLPGERQRDIVSFLANKGVVEEVTKQWLQLLAKLESAPPPAPSEPETQIVYCEVPRKWTFEEMLEKMSEVELTALLTAKQLARENRRDELLYENALRAGAVNLPKVAPFVAKLDGFQPGRKHGPRIAIIGISEGFKNAVEAEVKTTHLDTKLSFPQAHDHTTVARCDYAIVCRGKLAASNSDGDSVIGELTRNRVALLNDPNVPAIMQEIRNFCSRQ